MFKYHIISICEKTKVQIRSIMEDRYWEVGRKCSNGKRNMRKHGVREERKKILKKNMEGKMETKCCKWGEVFKERRKGTEKYKIY